MQEDSGVAMTHTKEEEELKFHCHEAEKVEKGSKTLEKLSL